MSSESLFKWFGSKVKVFASLLLAAVLSISLISVTALRTANANSGGGLNLINLQGIPMKGEVLDFDLTYDDFVSTDQWEDFYSEEESALLNIENVTVASSNSNIVEAEINKEKNAVTLNIKDAGTATISVSYQYQGEYALYEASQNIEVTSVGEAIPITSIELDGVTDSYRIPVISKCKICGTSHGWTDGTEFDINLAPSGVTNNAELKVRVEDNTVLYADVHRQSMNKYSVDFSAYKTGTTDVTFYATVNGEPTGPEKTISVTVYEAELPKATIASELNLDSLYIGSEYSMESVQQVLKYDTSSDYVTLLNSGSVDNGIWVDKTGFVQGISMVHCLDGAEKIPAFTLTVKDSSIAKAEADEWGETWFYPVKIGETEAEVQDIFGNSGTCTIKVFSFGEEAQREYKLSVTEIDLAVGEYIDLRDYITGTANNRYFVVKSSDKSVVTTHNGAEEDSEVYDVTAGVFRILGRSEGEATVTVGVLNDLGGDDGGSDRYVDNMTTADFATLKINVKDTSTKDPITSGEGRDDVTVDIVGSTDYAQGFMDQLLADGGKFYISQSTLNKKQIENLIGGGTDKHVLDVFDFNFIDENNAVVEYGDEANLETYVVLRIPLSEIDNFKPGTLKVYYIEGETEYSAQVESWENGDYLYIFTNHFSDYVLTGELDTSSDNQGNPGINDGGEGDSSSNDSAGNGDANESDQSNKAESSESTKSDSDEKTVLPDTSDKPAAISFVLLLLIIVACAAAFVARRKLA